MATITKENIGLLHEKVTVKLEKTDYLPSFEKALKDYSKRANIPGFRKGMVPAGLIKKMYGASLFTDEVLKSVDRELINYLQHDKLDIFAQPIPLESDFRQLDVNNPIDYTFHFEIGMKPEFQLPDLTRASVKKYEVVVTDEMIDNEITRLRNRYGNMKDEETVTTEENVLNLNFVEIGEDGNDRPEGIKKDNSILVKYFREEFRKRWMGKKAGDSEMTDLRSAFDDKEREWIISDLGLKEDSDPGNRRFRIELTKIGLLEKRELQEDLFNQLYPNQDVKTEADFRNKIKEEIAAYWNVQAHNQIQDQVFHILVDQTQIQFPETFLKKWMRTQNEEMNSDEAVEKEFPRFLNQLKWTLIIDKVVSQQELKVTGDELRNFASQQLVSYMGGSSINPDEQWVKDYIDRMMKDKKYVEDSYRRIETQQVLEWAAGQVQPVPEEISAESFSRMLEEHRHHHH